MKTQKIFPFLLIYLMILGSFSVKAGYCKLDWGIIAGVPQTAPKIVPGCNGAAITFSWKNGNPDVVLTISQTDGPNTYNHTDKNGEGSFTFTGVAPGTYSYSLIDNILGCDGLSGSFTIENPIPKVSVIPSGPTTFCEGGSVVLNAGAFQSYHWNNNSSNENLKVISTGDYSVTVTNLLGCKSSSAPVHITVNQLPTASMLPAGSKMFSRTEELDFNRNSFYTEQDTPQLNAFDNGTMLICSKLQNCCPVDNEVAILQINQPVNLTTSGGTE